jgi:DNA repair/transcription protein MET18/MMS19
VSNDFGIYFKVLQAIEKSLDDPKRKVREEAIRCRQAWLVT